MRVVVVNLFRATMKLRPRDRYGNAVQMGVANTALP
jgi:hypothetical protein